MLHAYGIPIPIQDSHGKAAMHIIGWVGLLLNRVLANRGYGSHNAMPCVVVMNETLHSDSNHPSNADKCIVFFSLGANT